MKSALPYSAASLSPQPSETLQLACLAATPTAVRAALASGADWVRIPYRLRNSSECSIKNPRLADSIQYAHDRVRKLVLDLGLSSPALSWSDQHNALAWAEDVAFDAIVLSDAALALYCAARHPKLPVHFVAPSTICARTATLLKLQLNVSRIIIPHTISAAQLVEISSNADVELEILGFGCSSIPAAWKTSAGACNDAAYTSERHLSTALRQLPLLASLGIRAIQVEPGSHVAEEVRNVARVWRTAIDRCLKDGSHFTVDPSWARQLGRRR